MLEFPEAPDYSIGSDEAESSMLSSSTIGSPMSANNLMFSRQLGVPAWRLAWVWNMPAALLNFTTTVVLGLVLQQIARLG